jgi:hypothetical protein
VATPEGVPERCSTRAGSGLACKYQIRLERLARDRYSSLCLNLSHIWKTKKENFPTLPPVLGHNFVAASSPIGTLEQFSSLKKLIDASTFQKNESQKLPIFPPINLIHPALMSHPAPVSISALGPAASNTCAKCGITFRMTSDLVYHMRTHHTRGSENWREVSRYFKIHFNWSYCHFFYFNSFLLNSNACTTIKIIVLENSYGRQLWLKHHCFKGSCFAFKKVQLRYF